MSWRIFLSALLAIAGLLPAAAQAQAQATAPSGFLVKTAAHDEQLCQGDAIVYKLEFFDTSPAATPPYTATIRDTLPGAVTFVAHDGSPGVNYDARANTVTLTIPVDPTNPGSRRIRPPVLITVTVNSPLTDGTEIVNLATGMLGDQSPVGAQVKSIVACDPNFEPPRSPDDYPTQPDDPALVPDYEQPLQLVPGTLPLEAQAATSLLSDPEIGDEDPPGFLGDQLFLPLVLRGGGPAAAAAGPDAPASAAAPADRIGGPVCDYVYPWVSRYNMTEAAYQADATFRDNAGYRPISVTANGAGSDTRFAALWVKDNKYGKDWSLKHGLTNATYTQWINTFQPAGLVPLTIDLYGTTAAPRYVATWGKENKPTVEIHGVNEAVMQAEIDKRRAEGYRPVWVTGLGNPANNNLVFAGIWTRDALTGTMSIGLTAADISTEGLARQMTDNGFRMAHLSGYQTLDNDAVVTRYAAVWIKGDPCDSARWEAYRDFTSTQYQVKASAQRPVSSVKTVAAASITLDAADLGNASRVARVALKHNFATPPLPQLAVINEATPGLFRNGDILVLQMAPGYELYVQELSNGNIKLRSWNPSDPNVVGQFFWLRSHQYRLVLQYNSSSQKWIELQRNNISPDYYYPVSLDEYGPTNNRLYNSVWRAGPVARAWRVTGIPAGSDPLAQFDSAMLSYMQRRNVPGAALAVTVNGRLVLARGYSWNNGALPATQPDATFRLASVSKPLTAIGIMRLVQNGQLNLDAKIKDIPGFDAWLKSNNWTDPQIKNVTVRQLLHHTGGWDRAITADPMLNDFAVCAFQNPDALPTTQDSITAYVRSLPFDHTVGFAHAYSNFGYLLLGRIIEIVSGKNYNTFMRDNVLNPVNAQGAFLGSNFAGGDKEVQYFTPINTTGASRLGWTGFNQPGRQLCNWQHAELAPSSYGGYNIDPMAAHGGWVSSAIDLARVMVGVDNGTLVNAASRSAMWSRPDGRARRVVVYDSATPQYLDRTLHARKGLGGMTFTGIKKIGDFIAIGNGLERFGSIEFKFEAGKFGAGHDLRLIYLTKSGAWRQLTADADGLADGTKGFTQDGFITFTPPLDWEPFVFSVADSQPKFYVWLYSTTTPTKAAVIDTAQPSGEAGYALGWGTTETTATLAYSNGNGFLTPGNTITGEISKARAVIQQVLPAPGGSGTLIINTLRGGPFRPNEKLLVGTNTAGKALDREWAQNAAAGHNGLLWGTRAFIQHRTDGVNWAVVFNQENAYDPYWYLPNDAAIVGALETLANDFTAGNKWPNINLFGLYD